MNLQPVQKRRLESLEENIEHLKDATAGKGLWHVIRISFVMAVLVYIFNFVFEYFSEDRNLVQYVNSYHPLRLLSNWVFWFLVNYFIYRSNKRSLEKKKAELAAARKKYGLGEEAPA